MKIATKIRSGYGILIALMAGLVAYQVGAIHQMQTINRNLSQINFAATRISLQLRRHLDLVDEWVKKYFATQDPEYGTRLSEYRQDFERSLVEIEAKATTDKERQEISRLAGFWREFSAVLEEELVNINPEKPLDTPRILQDQLEMLHVQTQTVYEATLTAVESQVEKSRLTGEQAEVISWTSAAIALILSLLVSFFIVRSISVPLSHLTEGTRAIAEGRFFYRLDTSRADEFAQLAKDFNTMTERLNELDEMKKDFVSHVSHELKAPLASMQETVQLLLEEVPGPLTEKQRRLLDLNLESAKRLSSMIGTLLDISRMEAGVMEYELKNTDLASLVRKSMEVFETQARDKELEVKLAVPEEPLWVHCDEDRILQVLNNLLGNAIKFSPRREAIEIGLFPSTEIPESVPEFWRGSVASLENESAYTILQITDRGPGVPDSDKMKIFEKFHQAHKGKKTAGQGAGLGLAISRTIVEAHRGAIWVEDRDGHGSRFCVLLPPGEGRHKITYRASSPI